MNNTVIKTKKDFVVMRNPEVISKVFLYNIDTEEFVCERDGVTPIAHNPDTIRIDSDDLIIRSFKSLPKPLKILLR